MGSKVFDWRNTISWFPPCLHALRRGRTQLGYRRLKAAPAIELLESRLSGLFTHLVLYQPWWPDEGDYQLGLRRAIQRLINLHSWRGLLGSESKGPITEAEERRFALAFRDMLQVVLEQEPEPGSKIHSRPVNTEGYIAIQKLLDQPPPRRKKR